MKKVVLLAFWVLVMAFSAGWAQKGPTNTSSMGGLTFSLKGCSLSGANLTCTVEVSNPNNKAISVSLPPASVQALTATGWLYQGRVSSTSVQLRPGAKTELRLTYPGVDNPTGIYSMIQVGEARFLGVVVPGAPKLAVSSGYCFFTSGAGGMTIYSGYTCILDIANDTDTDLKITLNAGQSYVVTELGSQYFGERTLIGGQYSDAVREITIPGRTVFRVGVVFGPREFKLYEKAQLVRFQVGGGFWEMRNVPMRYCGQQQNEACGSPEPF